MRWLLLLCLFFRPNQEAIAQQGFDLPNGAQLVGANPFNQLYVLNGRQLQLYDASGRLLSNFSSPALGTPDQVVFCNPLAPLLFYRDFMQFIVLDNRLNPVGRAVDLLELGYADVRALALVDENRIWIYDQTRDRLELLLLDEKRSAATSPVITTALGRENRPTVLQTNISFLYLLLDSEGVAELDAFGAWKRFIPVPGAKGLQVAGKVMLVETDSAFLVRSLSGSGEINLPKSPNLRVALAEDRLWVQDGTRITSRPLTW